MPEGDSLRRTARRLTPVLLGFEVVDVWFRRRPVRPIRPGQRVENVRAVGKHLLIDFDRRLSLRTHLGMTGSWRVASLGDPLPSTPKLRIVLDTTVGRAMCFAAPTIETFVRSEHHSPVDHLGPDLSNDDVDLDEIVARSRRFGASRTLAEVLLDQQVAAGVGNVFKSEIAFLAGVYPFVPASELSVDELERIWTLAHELLVDNRDRARRRTTDRVLSPDLYVYGRFRRPCLRCGSTIRFSPAGRRTQRSTYWCPRCQPQRLVSEPRNAPQNG